MERTAKTRRQRGMWDLALLVLGLNLWSGFLLIPVLHQGHTPALLLSLLPLALLLIGVLTRHQLLLTVAYPLALLPPVFAARSVAGVNVYATWSFALVGAGFVAYMLGSSWLLALRRRPPTPPKGRDLEPRLAQQPKWRRRRRVYLLFATAAGAIPAVLIHALFLHRKTFVELQRFYPERAAVAGVLFGVLAIGLYGLLFWTAFARPLRAHIRGDPTLAAELQVLRRAAQRRPRPVFYVSVAVALAVMVLLFLWL